jgi:hypothetical protein
VPNGSLKLYGSVWGGLITALLMGLSPAVAQALPNGTWLSKPQIWFHSANNTLDQVMARIQGQRYRYVFLDFRNVSDRDQQRVVQAARRYQLVPIVWVQSPQYRRLTIEQIIHEARHADGVQVDDHFFANYSLQDFQVLRSQYQKLVFCSIQPFQAGLVPPWGCNQLDVQCYVAQSFSQCMGLANRLKSVVSLSSTSTLIYQHRLNGQLFNVFLWPHSDEYLAQTTP